ncbi:MAG TPA: C25 family cysteine peptidase, partial [Saprospiraceae bacterium]|nr:C25 family cysteine peptidase [Saprospiraceae bacterium]
DCKINGNTVKTLVQSGSGMITTIIAVSTSLLTTNTNINLTENDPDSKGFIISNLSVSYNRSWQGPIGTLYKTELPDKPGNRYVEMNNFYQGGPVPILYDQSANIRMIAIQDVNLTKFNLPDYVGKRNLIISSGASISLITQLQNVSFKDYKSINADYVIITNKVLYNDGSGTNYILEYADYRKSTNGGSHQVAVVEIQELYDQFAYGNDRNIISIRNFAHYIQKKWSLAKSIFIIGKGREYPDVRFKNGLMSESNRSFYVPTYGSPGSDNLFVITQGKAIPILAIGRIAAETGEDIKTYLDKIKDYEAPNFNQQTIEDQSWKKEIIHLGGGDTKSLQVYLKGLLTNMASIIENNRFGANVSGFYKTSTDPIQVSQNEQIFNRINKGVSIITFLGHSAVGTFDFSIDNPQNYNNYRKYPLMFSLGCYSGNYNTSARGIGENFCFYKDKGALGFVATSYVGIPSILSDFTSEFYNQLGGPLYGSNVGEVLKGTYIQLNKQASESNRLLTEQMSYHGDPAYRINAAPGPDYTIDASSLKFSPQVLTVQLDSFSLDFNVLNLGENKSDTLGIVISQKLPGGEERQLKLLKIKAPANTSKLHVKLLNFGIEAFGQNTLHIKLDPDNKIVELPSPDAENNNELGQSSTSPGYSFYITDDAAIPVIPYQFSIVNKPDITLISSTADPFAKEKVYFLELDTTLQFNSPVKFYGSIKQKGGLLNWKPLYNWKDSTVYYWRITPDSTQTGVGAIWQHSSFFYRPGSKEGWSQGHQYQFKEDELVNIKIPVNTGKMAFIDDIKDIFVQNYVRKSGIYPAYYINNGLTEISYGNDIASGVYVGVIDPLLGTAWINPLGGQYGSETPSNWRVRRAYPYSTGNPAHRAKLISFLKDTIPDGHYVVFFTIQDENNNYKPEDWAIDSLTLGTNLFQLLEKQGATLIRKTIGNVVPYSFVYRKNVKPLGETIASSINGLAYL